MCSLLQRRKVWRNCWDLSHWQHGWETFKWSTGSIYHMGYLVPMLLLSPYVPRCKRHHAAGLLLPPHCIQICHIWGILKHCLFLFAQAGQVVFLWILRSEELYFHMTVRDQKVLRAFLAEKEKNAVPYLKRILLLELPSFTSNKVFLHT